MPRENAYNKASRLLVEARLEIRAVREHTVFAVCRGDSGERYEVTAAPSGWRCSCQALTRCSHIYALQRVTLRPKADTPGGIAWPASTTPDHDRPNDFEGSGR